MQGGQELENLLAMFARTPTATLHFRARRLGREAKGCPSGEGYAMDAGEYFVTA
jgi:hypothetical protein